MPVLSVPLQLLRNSSAAQKFSFFTRGKLFFLDLFVKGQVRRILDPFIRTFEDAVDRSMAGTGLFLCSEDEDIVDRSCSFPRLMLPIDAGECVRSFPVEPKVRDLVLVPDDGEIALIRLVILEDDRGSFHAQIVGKVVMVPVAGPVDRKDDAPFFQ
jgi:hypothetical protein